MMEMRESGQNKRWDQVRKILPWAARVLAVIIYLLGFYYVRFYLGLVFVGLVFADLKKKRAVRGGIDFLLAVFFLVTVFSVWPELSLRTDRLRFRCLEGGYETAVQKLIPDLEETDRDAVPAELEEWEHPYPVFGRRSVSNPLLSEASWVWYKKEEDSILILFQTAIYSGYAYFSDERAFEMLEDYRDCLKINDHWAVYREE